MSLRKTVLKMWAVGAASTALLSLLGGTAKAASFNFSYMFDNGPTFSAVLAGDVDATDSNVVSISAVESTTVLDSAGDMIAFSPDQLSLNSTLTLDGSFAAIGIGDVLNPVATSEGFSVFNNLLIANQTLSFADLVYLNSQGNTVRASEAFRNSAFSFEQVDIPESSSTAVLLTALAGMGLMIVKKQSARQST